MKAKRIVFLGVLSALASIMFLIENLFPPLIVPGAKLGLGNIFVLLALVYLGFCDALIVVVVKSLIAAIFGGISTLLYSIPASITSLIVSFCLLNFSKSFSIVAISSIAAIINNLIQNVVFALITKTADVLLYSPYLALIGLLSGIVTGLATFYVLRYLSTFVINKFNLKTSYREE